MGAYAVGVLLAAARMKWLDLWRAYPFLTSYLLASGLGLVVLTAMPVRTTYYFWVYVATQTLSVLLAIFVTLELLKRTLAERPALSLFARRSLVYFFIAASVLAGFAISIDRRHVPGRSIYVERFLTFERSINLIVVVLLLLFAVFLAWFPVKLRRNVLIYSMSFLVGHAARALGLAIVNLSPSVALVYISMAMQLILLVCMSCWLIGMRREADDAMTVSGFHASPERVEEVGRALDTINASLSRFQKG